MSEVRIPEGWEKISLDRACHVLMGQSPDGCTINQSKQGFPFLQGNAEFGEKYPNEKNWTINPIRIAEKNSILLSVRAPVGELNIADKDYCIGRGLASLTYKKCALEYLYFAINHNKYQFLNLSQGSTFEAINRKNIEELNILCPKQEKEQQKIAEILSEVDSAIDKTKQLIEKNKRLKTALMQDLLSYGIDENGQIRNPKTHQFKPSPLGDIPVEWDYTAIGKSIYLKARIGWQGLTTEEYQKDGDYLLVTGVDFNNGKIDWKNCFYVDKSRYNQDTKIQIKNNDILVTKDGTIGKVAIVEKMPKKATLNSGVFVLRPLNNQLVPFYLFIILTSKYFEKFIENLSAGSTINHLYQKDFVNFQFPFPKSKTEQQKIANILSSQDEKIEKLQNKFTKLNHLKTSLMQDLLSGKVRVTKLLESKQ